MLVWKHQGSELKNGYKLPVLLSCSGKRSIDDIPEKIRNFLTLHSSKDHLEANCKSEVELKEDVLKVERAVIINALIKSNYNKSEAVHMLKIDRKNTLQ